MANLAKFGSFNQPNRDILSELLADKRSPNTRRAYARDLKDFFRVTANQDATPQLVAEFLQLDRFSAIELVLTYKATLIEKSLSEATVNRRLAALRSLVKYAQKIGKCAWSLEEIEGEKLQSYRDTSGVEQDIYKQILDVIDRSTLAGKRNYALLLLLWTNALRRAEVAKLNRCDINPDVGKLKIYGKGRGTQAEFVSLSTKTVEAIEEWIEARGACMPTDPLFTSLSNNSYGRRLTGDGIYLIVVEAAERAGIKKRLSPHRVRHSSITAALIASNGNITKVQKLSRHKHAQTVLIYLDNAQNAQGEISDMLSDLI